MGSEKISSLRPFFDGSDYPHWKFKMELYLDCDSIKLWDIIRKRWESPKATVNGIETIVERDEWSAIQQEGNHKNKKGYDHYSILYVKRKRSQTSTLLFGQGNVANFRESL